MSSSDKILVIDDDRVVGEIVSALANAMGGTLGRLVELTTEFEPVYPRAFKARAPRNASAYMMVSETPITPTEITIQSAIVARGEFLPTP